MKFKMLVALSASLLAIGCASQGLIGEGDSRAIAPGVARQAAQQHPQILAEFGGAETGARANYVAQVGRRVAAQSGVAGDGYTITLLNSPVNNAFAVPGGYVYITRQLLALMNDEAELASVLGHEVGHIAADHSRQRQNRGLLSQLGSVAVGVLTGSSEAAQLAGQVGQGLFLSYSRSQEYESDQLGIRYLAGSGYDPNAAASMLTSLGAASNLEARIAGRDGENAVPSWARTHPLSEDRVRRATQQAQATGRAGQGDRNRDQFLAMIDGLMVDDDPRQGVIEGRTFKHPDLRLRFTAPDGYAIQNGTRAVSISGSGGQAQFAGGQHQGDLSAYVGQVFRSLVGQSPVTVPTPRSTNVNGIPAAYATVPVTTQQGQLDLTVFAYQPAAGSAYHFALITPARSGVGPFQSMVGSLARLSQAEAGAIRPRVIDVVTVRSGDTVHSLAERMAYPDLKMERFLTLNALSAGSRLVPGSKVKIVAYGQRT